MFDIPPKCPALANKLTGIFGWRQTYEVSKKQEGITHNNLQKSYSLALPRKTGSSFVYDKNPQSTITSHAQKSYHSDGWEQILITNSCKDSEDRGNGGSRHSSSGISNADRGSETYKDYSAATPCIEVTSAEKKLHFRRNSHPSLLASPKDQFETNKHLLATPACGGDDSLNRTIDKIKYLSPQTKEEIVVTHRSKNFIRSSRLSMQFLSDGNGHKWMEAAEKLQSTKSLPREAGKRKDSRNQTNGTIQEKDGEMLLIINEYGGPLGLTATPDSEHNALIVQNVEEGSSAEKGRMRRGDRILEINGAQLTGLSEAQIQEHLRRSLELSELRVRVIRGDKIRNSNKTKIIRSDLSDVEAIGLSISTGNKVATVSSSKKSLTAAVGNSLQVANTRKLGRKIEINLKKGLNGLGFSVTTRDNPAGGDCPVYIKNILPRGAAIEDGRLKPGDRLLEVDGLLITGKTQSDVVSILRSTQPGATVKIVVSRQEELVDIDEREINSSEAQKPIPDDSKKPSALVSSSCEKDLKKFTISKTNSLRQSSHLNESQHFINSGSETAINDSFHHGNADHSRDIQMSLSNSVSSYANDRDSEAAAYDARIGTNDQLQNVNEVSLLSLSNSDAMENVKGKETSLPSDITGYDKRIQKPDKCSTECLNAVITHSDYSHSSQLNLEKNNSGHDHFSRDAIGRRSISEKHHAALDARETGTYQRNKKTREDRERKRRLQLTKSVIVCEADESDQIDGDDLNAEALDKLGELGPSLGLKKSSSLESLQTMIQKIQISNESRGTSMLRQPRGRCCQDNLKAAVAGKNDLNQKGDLEDGFSPRNGHFQSSLNDERYKNRTKNSILHGIGHIFHFGKNRKDLIVPKDTGNTCILDNNIEALVPSAALSVKGQVFNSHIYKSPLTSSNNNESDNTSQSWSTVIRQNDTFNNRYQHYVNCEDSQHHQSSRKHQHNHLHQGIQTTTLNNLQIHSNTSPNGIHPKSKCYEYKTVQHNISRNIKGTQKILQENNDLAKTRHPQNGELATRNECTPNTLNNSNRSKGPFVTQVTIGEQIPTAKRTNNISKQYYSQGN